MNLKKAWIFIKKDFIIESSYKMGFILALLSSLFPIISLFFVGELVANSELIGLSKYGGKYFPFALIGMAFVGYFQLAVSTFSGSIKRAQMAGCLEAILSSQTSSSSIVLMSSFYSFLSAGVQLVLVFLVATLFLDFDFSNMNLGTTIITVLTSLVVFVSLGILSAAGTVIFKQGEPVGWIFGVVSTLLSGAIFPVSIMPQWMQIISLCFPISYSLDALRLAILQHYSVSMLAYQLIILSSMALILFPLSLKAFQLAVEMGKRDGTLMQY